MQFIQQISNPDLQNSERKNLYYGQANTANLQKALEVENEVFWNKKGERKALKLFHSAAERVPAYKDFLKKNKINHEKIKIIDDFKRVPITNKENYVKSYSVVDRCWDGELSTSTLISTSSGTSGEPTFWPRGYQQELEAGIIHKLIYKHLFKVGKYKTLLVICFPMGVYVSGIATVLPSWLAAAQQKNLTIVTVGNNKSDALRVISNLQKDFEQVILIGHPFFIKDIIETGRSNGIDWSAKELRIMFCSGSFNEVWRRYIMNEAGLKKEDYAHIISTYGSSEMLLIGHETPVSIFSRVLMEEYSEIRLMLQDSQTVPNLFQYNPLIRYIENENNELIFTSNSGLPLIRFNLHDRGEVISFGQMSNHIAKIVPKWQQELKSLKEKYPLWQLPFVTLYGRSDYTVKFYAANIYPENIQAALNQKNFISKLTGKFTLNKDYNRNMDEYLEINIELTPSIVSTARLEISLKNEITKKLKEVNHEYNDAAQHHLGKDLSPRIRLWPYQDEKYFKPGSKPKYIWKK